MAFKKPLADSRDRQVVRYVTRSAPGVLEVC
jgi:hypothetical protein